MPPRRLRRATQRLQRFQRLPTQEVSNVEHSQPLLDDEGLGDGEGKVSLQVEVVDGKVATARDGGNAREESEGGPQRWKKAGHGCAIRLAKQNNRIAVMQQ